MLGVGIDPRFNQMDYSGFVKAAETSAQAQAQLGKDIGGAIQSAAQLYTENKKETAKYNAESKVAEGYLNSFKNVISGINPNAATGIENALQISQNPNLSPLQKYTVLSTARKMAEDEMGLMYQAGRIRMQQSRIANGVGGGGSSNSSKDSWNSWED